MKAKRWRIPKEVKLEVVLRTAGRTTTLTLQGPASISVVRLSTSRSRKAKERRSASAAGRRVSH